MRVRTRFQNLNVNENVETKPLFESFDLKGLANYILKNKVKNIIVLSGAGISVASGIPDFRSPKTGLFAKLQKYNLPTPESMFTLSYFEENPKPFCTLAKELYPGNYDPTPVHYFIRLLHEKGLLLRNYTQNIDTLERVAGIPGSKLVEAHGSFHIAHCIECGAEYSCEYMKKIYFNNKIPICTECDNLIKPDIIFYEEALPQRYHKMSRIDFGKCDLLLVIGTALQVAPFCFLVDKVKKNVPRVLLNLEVVYTKEELLQEFKENVGGFEFERKYRDIAITGDCQHLIMELCDHLGWKEELLNLIPPSNKVLPKVESEIQKKKAQLKKKTLRSISSKKY